MRAARGLTIGKLADLSGVNLETVRYYERIGLMPAPERTEGGHRLYSEAHQRRLTFIRRGRELGFGIGDIRALLDLAEPGHRSCEEVRPIAASHLAEVRAKIGDLTRLESILSETVSRCEGVISAPSCPVLEMLEAA
jgi:MerR family transcriptional regulator, mercuric resistance operon regulatory protein